MIKKNRYTEASRYVQMLKQCVPTKKWDEVCGEIHALSDLLKSNKDYVRWATRDQQRWSHIIQLCTSPELIRMLQLLQKSKNITFIIDIAYELSENYANIIVEHAGSKQPNEVGKLHELADSLWGKGSSLRFLQNDALLDGVKLTYGNQTYDMSFRHYRHNLVSRLRQAQ